MRIVEHLEKDGEGLNLTWEVRDGIRNHQTSTIPATPEGKIVRLSDKIAYINHDIDDAIRGLILTEDDIPKELRNTLGHTTRERLDNLIHDVIMSSLHNIDIMDKECRNDLEPIAMSAEGTGNVRSLQVHVFQCISEPGRKGRGSQSPAYAEPVV